MSDDILNPARVWIQIVVDQYAHTQAKLVHHDIKPANLLVTRDGQLKVTDFGIARGLSEASVRLTTRAEGRTSGTVLYASPQQLMGEKPTEADDLYALGATLYELLTGEPPFFRGDPHSLIMQVKGAAAGGDGEAPRRAGAQRGANSTGVGKDNNGVSGQASGRPAQERAGGGGATGAGEASTSRWRAAPSLAHAHGGEA